MIVLDSDLSLDAALDGSTAPPEILAAQTLVMVRYCGSSGFLHQGQIVVHRELADEVSLIFSEICQLQFPIFLVLPVCRFNWSDDLSMNANNTSGFNYRRVVGAARLSHHATGRAVDLNPVQNPYLKNGLTLPPGALYDPAAPGTLLADGPVVAAFERRGWEWGGRWEGFKDWHHFQKPA